MTGLEVNTSPQAFLTFFLGRDVRIAVPARPGFEAGARRYLSGPRSFKVNEVKVIVGLCRC